MSTVNKSTGFSPFQLRMGRTPRVLPPLVPKERSGNPTEETALNVIRKIHQDTLEAQDNLLKAKISQSVQANESHTLTFPFKISERVRLSTFNRRNEFKTSGELCVAKFMPRYDGPFQVVAVNKSKSMVTLDLPPNSKRHPVFHTSEVLPYIENDPILFPSCEFAKPCPILDDNGNEEYIIRDIIDERRSGRGFKYLVHWDGYGKEENRWLPRKLLEDTEALDIWLAQKV